MPSSPATVTQVTDKLYLIALTPPLTGFSRFIGIWLYSGPPAFLVDVGPSSTSAALLQALEDIGVHHLDYLLMTHVHIDHAGGVGQIAKGFPKARIVGHPKGLPHLVQPDRLWEGTLNTLGATAQGYGEMHPLPPDCIMDVAALDEPLIQPISTPGHAPHHISYHVGDILFAGEAGGVCLSTDDGRRYLRPATPPRFFLDITLKSIDRLQASASGKIAYSHFGLYEGARALLKSHRDQLLFWQSIIGKELLEGGPHDLCTTCLKHLLEEDVRLEGYRHLPAAEQRREEGFLRNSIKGFIGYLQETAGG
jgi:glyoxylase-like metal-dependent hydrolase (beta-lactamase superfamily II)